MLMLPCYKKAQEGDKVVFSIKKIGDFALTEVTEDELDEVNAALAAWELVITDTESFFANNDGGIDGEYSRSSKKRDFLATECIIHGGKVIGFYAEKRVFLIADANTHRQHETETDERGGPYGSDIDCTTIHALSPKSSDLDLVLRGKKVIGGAQFLGQDAIKEIIAPEYLEKIGARAFFNCTALEKVYLDKCKVTVIPSDAFQYCAVREVTFPKTLKRIEESAFAFCKITSLDFPDSLEFVHRRAFYKCFDIECVVLPKNTEFHGFYSADNYKVLFKGTKEEYEANIASGKINYYNDTAFPYFYSEEKTDGCWHYVDDKPQIW